MVARGRGALVVLAAAVGASRAHYPSHVVIGAALGAMVALGLSRVQRSSATIQSLRARLVRPFDPDQFQGLLEFRGLLERCGHDWLLVLGRLLYRYRQWFPPALIAGLFAIAVPPTD